MAQISDPDGIRVVLMSKLETAGLQGLFENPVSCCASTSRRRVVLRRAREHEHDVAEHTTHEPVNRARFLE